MDNSVDRLGRHEIYLQELVTYRLFRQDICHTFLDWGHAVHENRDRRKCLPLFILERSVDLLDVGERLHDFTGLGPREHEFLGLVELLDDEQLGLTE